MACRHVMRRPGTPWACVVDASAVSPEKCIQPGVVKRTCSNHLCRAVPGLVWWQPPQRYNIRAVWWQPPSVVRYQRLFGADISVVLYQHCLWYSQQAWPGPKHAIQLRDVWTDGGSRNAPYWWATKILQQEPMLSSGSCSLLDKGCGIHRKWRGMVKFDSKSNFSSRPATRDD
eukprot:360503-Chlamydomonas_euryale.AAC.7